MQIAITGHHIDITPALKASVEDKFTRLERHFERVTDAHVILTVEKLRHKAEAKVQYGGSTVYADSVEPDMYAAIDRLVDKLNRRIKKSKEKSTDHHAREVNKSHFA
ncbi:MAG: ribosome-associated translation inhibitor RaiA [Gammaproteobacteria bacterium]|nr:ribosome-associated translation inhibitor RaiA [Gammaproteobacteria bacterium]